MSTALDFLASGPQPDGDGLAMPFAGSVTLRRRTAVTDPYSKQQRPDGPWGPDLTIEEAHVAVGPEVVAEDGTREQHTDRPTLLCPPGTDIRLGDQITDGSHVYLVAEHPNTARNPFTGWCPPMEVALEEVTG